MSKNAPNVRYGEADLESGLARAHLVIDLDGGTRRDVSTGVSSLDSLLSDLAKYAGFDLGVSVESEPGTDDHDIVCAAGSALGRALKDALAGVDAPGTGHSVVPSGESLVLCAIDLNGKPFLGWDVPFRRDWIGALATENIQQFFRAVATDGQVSLHVRKLAGESDVQTAEAAFRALGKALQAAAGGPER